MQPQQLKLTMDYRPALLWLMGEIISGKTKMVVDEFGRRFADLIPQEYYDTNKSGNIKWIWTVHWSRQDLVNAGMMASEKFGIWTITDAGKQFLYEHPDGGGKKLFNIIYQSKKDKYGLGEKTTQVFSPKKDSILPSQKRISESAYDVEKAHLMLDHLLSQIQRFLQGRSAIRPSDEQICDWIQLCYLLKLYIEGYELFKYIDKDQVEPWQFKRTRRYVKVCHANLRNG